MKEFIEKLISRLEEKKKNYCITSDWENAKKEVLNSAIKIVNQLAEEYNNGWIPCSERLPEKRGFDNKYLIQLSDGDMVIAYYVRCANDSEAYVWHDGFDAFEPIAWQPLPEPLEAEE